MLEVRRDVAGKRQGMADERLRKAMAAAVRAVLKEGLRKAEDPVDYLRSAASEIRQLVTLFEQDVAGSDEPKAAAIRAILAEEVEAAADELIRRLRH